MKGESKVKSNVRLLRPVVGAEGVAEGAGGDGREGGGIRRRGTPDRWSHRVHVLVIAGVRRMQSSAARNVVTPHSYCSASRLPDPIAQGTGTLSQLLFYLHSVFESGPKM